MGHRFRHDLWLAHAPVRLACFVSALSAAVRRRGPSTHLRPVKALLAIPRNQDQPLGTNPCGSVPSTVFQPSWEGCATGLQNSCAAELLPGRGVRLICASGDVETPGGRRRAGAGEVADPAADAPPGLALQLQSQAQPGAVGQRRLAPGSWSAPFQVWGVENREAALRLVPSAADGAPAHLKLKVADLAANPYPLLAAKRSWWRRTPGGRWWGGDRLKGHQCRRGHDAQGLISSSPGNACR
ncbi:hypothetical protein VB737_15535 [Synechococcus sp. BA-120 BA3]|nr:hypothetical protein [Synechococcus sp. BA-120 BA3]